MSIMRVSAQINFFDQAITAADYQSLATKTRAIDSQLNRQESRDLEVAMDYLELKGKHLQKLGIIKDGYQVYLYRLLNGASPRKIILTSAGIMLAECAGDMDCLGEHNNSNVRSFQRKHYINTLLSRGIGFSVSYGGVEAEPKGVDALKKSAE